LIEGLLVKYSVQCKFLGYHGDDRAVKGLTGHHFSTKIHPTEKKCIRKR
jgi:hypothetical protein